MSDNRIDDLHWVGRTLSHYRLESKLGAGGMGEVYLARDLALGRQAAIKVLPADASPALKARLVREAEACARLQHPGIATFYETAEVDGVTFIAMEYVRGQTLRSRLKSGAMPAAEAVGIVSGLLEALGHAHAAGVLHRDIKPENIMLTDERLAKLLDFGLAKRFDEISEPELATATVLTQQGLVVGTLGYMSPEQLRGQPVDVRSDLFSLGAVFYEALSGRPAFPGATVPDRIAAILTGETSAVDDPAIPPQLRPILTVALSRNPSERYPSAAAFLSDLRNVESEAAVAPLPDTMAVLDFENITGNPDDAWIGSGMAETLGADLARIPSLRVVAREKMLRARGALAAGAAPPDALDLGLALGCRLVLSGGYQRMGPALRVTMRLTDVPTARWISTVKVDGSLEGIFEIQDKLSSAAASSLNLTAKTPVPQAPPKLEAYELYARGRRLWFQLEKGSIGQAAELYELAVKEDPSFSPALTGLSAVHAMRFTFTTDSADLEAAATYASRALEIDPTAAEPHIFLGYVYLRQWKLEEAFQEEMTAAELNPAHEMAPYMAACARAAQGRPRDALALYQHTLELDPHDGWSFWGLGWAHLDLGDDDAALWSFERALELENRPFHGPTVGAGAYLAECLRRLGRLDEARARCLEALESVERSDHMYRDTFRGICLCTLGRTALDQGDLTAAATAFHQAVSHLQGRPRALGGGYLLVQALAGMARAGEGAEFYEQGLRLFRERDRMNFGWLWSCTEELTALELAHVAEALGRPGEADDLRQHGCQPSMNQDPAS